MYKISGCTDGHTPRFIEEDGITIAMVYTFGDDDSDPVDVNSEFIVKACNMHEKLIDGIRYAIEQLEASGLWFDHPTILKLKDCLQTVND